MGNYLADYAETSHKCSHPPGNVSLRATVGVPGATARAHVQGNDVPDVENGWTDRAQTWYIEGTG